MQKLPDFVSAFSHHFEPAVRDGSQFTWMLFHPCIDGWIPLDSAIESQQFRSHDHSAFFLPYTRKDYNDRDATTLSEYKRRCRLPIPGCSNADAGDGRNDEWSVRIDRALGDAGGIQFTLPHASSGG